MCAIRVACNREGNILEIIRHFVLVKVAGDVLPMLMIWRKLKKVLRTAAARVAEEPEIDISWRCGLDVWR